MANFISTIQDGILNELAALDRDQPGGYLRQRTAFSGAALKQIIQALQLRAPAAVIAFKSAEIVGGPFQKRDDITLRFYIWCADFNLRGQQAGLSGSGVSGEGPGSFQVVEDVISTLRHKRFTWAGRESLGVCFHGAEWIAAEEGLAIMRLECSLVLPQVFG